MNNLVVFKHQVYPQLNHKGSYRVEFRQLKKMIKVIKKQYTNSDPHSDQYKIRNLVKVAKQFFNDVGYHNWNPNINIIMDPKNINGFLRELGIIATVKYYKKLD